MQSFLGSLNYYSRFIEDFAIYASVLYELREVDFYEINRDRNPITANLEREATMRMLRSCLIKTHSWSQIFRDRANAPRDRLQQ